MSRKREEKLLKIALRSNIPVLLWGPPGVGKTAMVHAVAENRRVETVIAAVREPSDFLGLPYLEGGSVKYGAPSWAQALSEEGGILFLDELSAAAPAVQTAALRVVLERVVGDTRLHPETRVVAAANPPGEGGEWELIPPLANRFVHMTISSPSAQEWAEWALSADLGEGGALVSGFLLARPEVMFKFPQRANEAGMAWPSPRSWEMAARVISSAAKEEELIYDLVASSVGSAAASEFAQWVHAADLPDPEELLADPETAGKLNRKRGDIIHAALAAVVSAVKADNTAARRKAAWRIIDAIEAIDTAAIAAKSLAKLHSPEDPVPREVRRFAKLLGI